MYFVMNILNLSTFSRVNIPQTFSKIKRFRELFKVLAKFINMF